MQSPARLLRCLAACVLFAAAAPVLHAQPFTLTVEAGDVDRVDSVVTFKLPEFFGPGVKEGWLVDANGKQHRFQVTETDASFILPQLPAGKTLELSYGASQRVLVSPQATSHNITLTNVGGKHIFLSGNQRLLEYQSEHSTPPAGTPKHFAHGGYLHRVFSPSGKVVTGDYPPDHPHQRGIWFAWTKTEHDYIEYTSRDPQTGKVTSVTNVAHPDFWNMGKDNGGQLTGEIVPKGVPSSRTFAGPVMTRLTATHEFRSHEWREQTGIEGYKAGAGNWLGVLSLPHLSTRSTQMATPQNPGSDSQTASKPIPSRSLRVPQPPVPGIDSQSPPKPVVFTNDYSAPILRETWHVTAYNAGFRTEKRFLCFDLTSSQQNVYPSALRLPKYHYGGLGVRGSAQWDPVDKVTMFTSNGDDRKAGDASKAKWVWMGGEVDGVMTGILTLIHPENFRFPQPLRLNPKNPQLCAAPSADGDWEIKPGETYVSRYRFVVMDGKPTMAEAERFWRDYAEPVKVTVK